MKPKNWLYLYISNTETAALVSYSHSPTIYLFSTQNKQRGHFTNCIITSQEPTWLQSIQPRRINTHKKVHPPLYQKCKHQPTLKYLPQLNYHLFNTSIFILPSSITILKLRSNSKTFNVIEVFI